MTAYCPVENGLIEVYFNHIKNEMFNDEKKDEICDS